jgi:hypothetical protein
VSAPDLIGAFRVTEARLRRNRWRHLVPGRDGLGAWEHGARGLKLIHSVALEQDGQVWEHVSVSRRDGQMPSWVQLRDTFREVAGRDALGVVVIPPAAEHVDIAEVAHVWHCLTRRPLPDFTHGGRSI